VHAIKEFAETNPDKYAASLRNIATLGGFTEKMETQVDVNINIRALSDSQLEDRIKALQAATGGTQIIDHQDIIPPNSKTPATDVAK